jgi:cell shape-determining protein MreC
MNSIQGYQEIIDTITSDVQHTIQYNVNKLVQRIFQQNDESNENFNAIKELPYIRKLNKNIETLKRENELLKQQIESKNVTQSLTPNIDLPYIGSMYCDDDSEQQKKTNYY